MGSDDAPVVVVVGDDLLGRSRVEETIARSGFVARPLPAVRLKDADLTDVRAIVADVDSDAVLAAAEALDVSSGDMLLVGFYAHVDRSRADRLVSAGWKAMPRGRLFRELPDLLRSL